MVDPIDIYCSKPSLAEPDVYYALEIFGKAWKNGQLHDFAGNLNDFDWAKVCDGSKVLPIELSHFCILARLIPDMVIHLTGFKDSNTIFDQVTSCVFDFNKDYKVTVPLVCACQVLLDIVVLLRQDVSRPYTQLCESVARAKETIKRYDVYTTMLKDDRAVQQTKDGIASLKSVMAEWLDRDRVATIRLAVYTLRRESLTPFCLLKHQPLLCGVLKYHIDRALYYIGIRLCNEWQCVLGVIHLYNAARTRGYLDRKWADLDTIIRINGMEHLLVGDPPTSANEFGTRLVLAHGVPRSTVMRELRRKDMHKSTKLVQIVKTGSHTGRLIKVGLPLLTVVRERYKNAGKRDSAFVLHDVELALRSSLRSRTDLQTLEAET